VVRRQQKEVPNQKVLEMVKNEMPTRPALDKFFYQIYRTSNLSIYCDKFDVINLINSIDLLSLKSLNLAK